jgi:hypothetical protein
MMSGFLYKHDEDPLVNRHEANKCHLPNVEQFKTKAKTHWHKPSVPGNFPG